MFVLFNPLNLVYEPQEFVRDQPAVNGIWIVFTASVKEKE